MKKIISIGKWILLGIIFSYFAVRAVMSFAEGKEVVFRGYETDTLAVKIEELKNKVLDDLKTCESEGYTSEDGLIVYDSNKVPSIGLYQFQVKTIQSYYKNLYNRQISGKEAILIALDEQKARELAKDVIFKADGLKNWTNCAIRKNLTSKVATIKELEK